MLLSRKALRIGIKAYTHNRSICIEHLFSTRHIHTIDQYCYKVTHLKKGKNQFNNGTNKPKINIMTKTCKIGSSKIVANNEKMKLIKTYSKKPTIKDTLK